MRFGKLLPAVLAAAATLMVLTGATAAATSPTTPNLSSAKAIATYLRSIGVNPARMVWQRGARNYAGPNCPGRRWTCTRSTRVVQSASDNGLNRVECPGNLSTITASQSCIVVQAGPTNDAHCNETTTSDTAIQDCNITQAGTSNSAVINEVVNSNSASPQSAVQTAEVTQAAHGGDNQLLLHQHVNQISNKGSPQSENAVQTAFPIVQTADGSGKNSAAVHQKQRQREAGDASSQTQNGTGGTDCNASSGFQPTTPNACVEVTQSTDSGVNDSRLDQGVDQVETSSGSAAQLQGSATGGLDAGSEQCVGPPACNSTAGTSLETVVQRKQQQQKSSGGSQIQYDPFYGGGVSQFGGTNDRQNVDQSAAQSASGGTFVSQHGQIVGSGHTPGSCTVGQTARQNSASSSISESQPDCTTPLIVETSCSSTQTVEGGGGSCEVTNPSPPCEFTCDCVSPCILLFATTVLPSTPTNGALLDPLDLSDQT
jgi:hypothetical protein